MNPDETNPTTNTGVTGGSSAGSVVPPALDFTSSSPAETTSLSMADSLASAADNLTSAGMAAKEPDTGSIEMDEIGASDPSARMERPNEPLVPAAPVPGSIGSVTSGPAVVAHDDANATLAGGATTTGSAAPKPFGTTGASSFGTSTTSSLGGATTNAGFGASTGMAHGTGMTANATSATGLGTAPMGASMSGVGATGVAGAMNATSAMNVASAGGSSSFGASSEPYNPFAAKMGASAGANSGAPTSSMNVPAGLQPATEKFSAKLPSVGAKKSSMLTVILGILAVVSLVMAIVFAILWQKAEANKEVVYQPTAPSEEGGVTQVISMVTCAKNFGAEAVDGLTNLTDRNMTIALNFADDQLKTAALTNRYAFADNESAEAARGYFDWLTGWYGEVAANAGVETADMAVDIAEASAVFNMAGNRDQLAGDYIVAFGLPVNETGELDDSRSGVQANYEANGYVCTED